MDGLLMDNFFNKKELLAIARAYQIVGRYDMKKQQLIDAIVEIEKALAEKALNEAAANTVSKSHDDYIKNLKSGDIVAFQFYSPFGRKIVRSAKIVDAYPDEEGVTVQDKIGNEYFIYKSNILWVKTGKRWPKYIYSMFKGEAING